MRIARYKTVRDAKKRIPYGIERQQTLMELVERRLAQAEVIRAAISKEDTPPAAVTILWHGQEEMIEHPEIWFAVYNDTYQGGDAVTRELVRRRFRNNVQWREWQQPPYQTHLSFQMTLKHLAFVQNYLFLAFHALSASSRDL